MTYLQTQDGAAVDTDNPLPVTGEVTAAVATFGTLIIGTPVITAGAYSAGDAVGGLMTFAGAARSAGKGGVIKDIKILDNGGQDTSLELWCFSGTITPVADNAAWVVGNTDLRKLVAIIPSSAGAWYAAGTPSACVVEVSQRYNLPSTSMYGQLVTRATPTFAGTVDVSVIVGFLQD